MDKRPDLNMNLSAEEFRSYYYLKEELVAFCRSEGLQTTGGKLELTERIAIYLSTGEKTTAARQTTRAVSAGVITKETVIESPFVCSEVHRAFFKEIIGKGFSFNVAFQKWMKSNSGKTYEEAVYAYYKILEEKKNSTTVIDKQFEYNTYIRAFFEDNPGRTLQEAIKCWKYKKSTQGHNRYEKADLRALTSS